MNQHYTLPEGWSYARIGDITQDIQKVDPSIDPESKFFYIDISAIDNERNVIDKPKLYKGSEAPSRARQLINSHDVVFSTVRTYLRNIALVSEVYDGQIASTGFSVLRAEHGIEPRYLYYYSLDNAFLSQIERLQRGTSYPAIRDQDLREQSIPVPPSNEQHRIVEAIETQFTRLDEGVAALKRLRTKLKRYKAAVLKAACEGNLVPQDPNDEPASELLKRILKERREKWETDQRAKGKDLSKLKYPEPVTVNTSDLPELPRGWVWAALGQVFDVYVGSTPSRTHSEYWNGDIPWVSSGEVAFCRIRCTKECITELGFRNSSTVVHPVGTVLLGMIGEGKTRGQAAILDIPACHNQNSAAIRVSEAGLSPGYLYYYLESTYEQTRRGSSGNNQPALNKARVQAMLFALPPLQEQARIVQECDRLLSVVEDLSKAIEHSLKRAELMRQSILRKAFLGQLVSQDLNDEPASELLKRIRSEREAKLKNRKTSEITDE